MFSLTLGAFVITLGLTAVARAYALRIRLLDVPNSRSSHSTPTARGGGVAIVLATAGAICAGAEFGQLEGSSSLTLLALSLPIAVVGYVDDHHPVSAGWRLIVHFVAAGILVYLFATELEPVVLPIAVLSIVWMSNLFNFMDGIDGIASIEAMTVGFGGAGILALDGSYSLALCAAIVGAATGGFLLWNWPPAKIFMGDVGSGFLGFFFGGLALLTEIEGAVPVVVWLILLGVFIVDATWTLLWRLVRGKRIYEAHRSHAYQRAARRLGSHRAVTGSVCAINLLWLLPLAALAAQFPELSWWLVLIAWFPLCIICWSFEAGAEGL